MSMQGSSTDGTEAGEREVVSGTNIEVNISTGNRGDGGPQSSIGAVLTTDALGEHK